MERRHPWAFRTFPRSPKTFWTGNQAGALHTTAVKRKLSVRREVKAETPVYTDCCEFVEVSATATYYIKTAADDGRNAMAMLENRIAESSQMQSDTVGTLDGHAPAEPTTIQQRVSA